MQVIAQIAFALIFLFAIVLFWRNMKKLNRNIRLGKKNWPNNNSSERWKKVVLNALGQKKMFKRPIPAILHFFVYAGFIIINIEILEIILDGLFGTHRIFAPALGNFYAGFINIFEFLALTVLISCVIFLIRRNILRVKRLDMKELNNFPRLDANIILITEVVLMTAFLVMNSTDQVLQLRGNEHYYQTGYLFFSGLLTPVFEGMSDGSLMAVERFGWWFHILGVLAFLNYLPYSKHLHIILSFPNTYYSRTEPQGKMYNMPEIQREVALMMDPNAVVDVPADASGETGKFGAKDVYDLQTTDILGAYSCTECGRCTASCPANITGKLLSPRKIMMDTRDRTEEIGRGIDKHGADFKDEKSLLGDFITHEEILACTSCQACVEACPVNIDPLNIINQLKRYMIMEEAKSPNSWNVMFGNIENNQAPWQFSPSDRFKWADDLKS